MDYWKWHSGATLVSGDEVLVTSTTGVSIYDGDVKTQWRKGKASLSTLHVFYQPDGDTTTVLKLALEDVRRAGEAPSIARGFAFSSDKIVLPLPAGKHCKLSFRQGGAQAFFTPLIDALQAAAWRRVQAAAAPTIATTTAVGQRGTGGSQAQQPQSPPGDAGPKTANMIGIAGVMKASADRSQMQGTFKDIDDVMDKASSLVGNIRHLKQRSGASADDAMELETIEATLGLGTLVAANSSGIHTSAKQAKFHAELGAELHAWMVHPSNAKRFGEMPVLPLIEVFALYNKARGGDLVSPEDVLLACKAMTREAYAQYTLEELASGAMVLVHKDRSIILARLATVIGPRVVHPRNKDACLTREAQVLARSIQPSKAVPTTTSLPATSAQLLAISEIQLASTLLVSVSTAKEVLERLERDGYLCSSDAGFGCATYYWNIFVL